MKPPLETVFAVADDVVQPVTITPVVKGRLESVADLTSRDRAWIESHRFEGAKATWLGLPTDTGALGRVLVGLGRPDAGDPCGPEVLNLGRAPTLLPPGTYRIDERAAGEHDLELAAIAWGLGGYRYTAVRTDRTEPRRLVLPQGIRTERVKSIVQAIHLGRDLINAPANALGPSELADVVASLAAEFGADLTVYRGEDPAFAEQFPLIRAVGQASPRLPRVIDLRYGPRGAPKLTLVGKGVCFDTGGLDIKPSSAMLLMKKDMGGAAVAIALAAMIMQLQVPVSLRLLVAAAENSIAGNAFRPGDVIRSRGGKTVEIGNTDAEGRLVLADVMSLADEETPDVLMTFATLTGAARVALGPDLPALFSTDDGLAASIERAGLACGDPVWRLPFWPGYERLLDSAVGDISNVSDGPFAGALTAALFLKKFVSRTKAYGHLDLYAWRQTARPLGPKGGEVQTARAVLAAVEAMIEAA
ncbi:MAG: M17 family metallopeptidase [Hyphomicrobiaceae bacterium]